MRLTPQLVTRTGRDDDWEVLRQIRNSCRAGLTQMTDEVSPEMQRRYRRDYDADHVRHYLFLKGSIPVGYGRLEERDGYVYPSCGVAEWHRGKGYGWEVVRLTLLMAGGSMKGELRLSNEVICKIDFALGWKRVGPPVGDIQPVECAWPPPFIRYEGREQEVYNEIVRYHESSSDGTPARDREGDS